MRYWVIAPYDSTKMDVWEKVWEYDLSKGVIAVGWKQLGNVSLCNEEKLKGLIEQKYKDKNKGWKTWSFNSMWNFWHNIQVGDVIIARKGTKCISAIGSVTKTAFYDENMGKERVAETANDYYSNFIGIQWNDSNRDIKFDKPVFSIQTIYKIEESRYFELLKGLQPPVIEEDVTNQQEFELEKHLEDFIISNFDQIFGGKLILYKDNEGRTGQQYPTSIGYIDILAKEPDANSFIVIELKKGRESDKVVGQTLRYMGWINENLCEENQKVKAIIICKEADEKLKFALKMTNNIELKNYSVDFKLIEP